MVEMNGSHCVEKNGIDGGSALISSELSGVATCIFIFVTAEYGS